MMYRIRNWLVATLLLLCAQVGAATLSDIQVSNGNQQARITLSFIGEPDYAFSHQSKRTVALDIKQTGVIQGLPLLFSGNNLVKAIRSGTPKDAQTLRLVVDLTENGKTEAVKRQNGSNYILRRHHRRHLSPVLNHYRRGDGPLGAGGHDPHPCPLRHAA